MCRSQSPIQRCWTSAPETLRGAGWFFFIYPRLKNQHTSHQKSKKYAEILSGCKPCCDWVLHRLLHAKRDAHDPTKSMECGWCLRWTSLDQTGTHWMMLEYVGSIAGYSYHIQKNPSWTTLTTHYYTPVRMMSRFCLAWSANEVLHQQFIVQATARTPKNKPCSMGLLENASFHSLSDWRNFPYCAFQWDAWNGRGNASRAMFHPAFGKANSI